MQTIQHKMNASLFIHGLLSNQFCLSNILVFEEAVMRMVYEGQASALSKDISDVYGHLAFLLNVTP